MEDNENIVSSEGTVEGTVEENAASKYIEMFDNLKTTIATSNSSVMDGVVKALADVEIQKRITTATKAFEEIKALDKTIKGLVPDQEFFDGDGKLLSSSYTKAKSEELKKAKKRRKELDQALTLALSDKGDFSKLNNLVK